VARACLEFLFDASRPPGPVERASRPFVVGWAACPDLPSVVAAVGACPECSRRDRRTLPFSGLPPTAEPLTAAPHSGTIAPAIRPPLPLSGSKPRFPSGVYPDSLSGLSSEFCLPSQSSRIGGQNLIGIGLSLPVRGQAQARFHRQNKQRQATSLRE